MLRKIIALTALLTAFFCGYNAAFAAKRDVIIDGDHGRLASVLQTPDDRSSYPLVMLLHGFSSHKETKLLRDIADALEKDGIASIRFDFNGHGRSEGAFQDMTIVNEVTDAEKVYDYVKGLPQVTSVSIAGHSQGGVVAGILAARLGEGKIKSVVLMAPAAVLHDNAAGGVMFGKEFDIRNLPEYVELRGGRRIGRRYIETAQKLDIYGISAKYKGPVLIIHGTADRIVPYAYGQRYKEIYRDADLKLLEGFDHAFNPDRAAAERIVTDYFKKRLMTRENDLKMEDTTMKKRLVAYFSASGVTAKVAKRLAKAASADLFAIEPEKPYTEADLNWQNRQSRSSVEMNDPSSRPSIASKVSNMREYDVVFVGFPVWWYREPSIIDTFMEEYDFKGKTVIPFATSGSSPIGDAGSNMQKLAPGAKVLKGKRFAVDVSEEDLKKWVAEQL